MKFDKDGLTTEYGEFVTPDGVCSLHCQRLYMALFAMSEEAAKAGDWERARLLKGQARTFKGAANDLRRIEGKCDGERPRQHPRGTDEQLQECAGEHAVRPAGGVDKGGV